MKWRLVSAFATGAVLASGIVYFAVRPDTAPQEVAKRQTPRQVDVPAPIPQLVAPPVSPPPGQAPPSLPPQIHARLPVREKPSPMPPLVRHPKEAVIAKDESPSLPPAIPAQTAAPTQTVEAPPAPAAAPAPAENVPIENVSLPAPNPTPNAEARVPHTVTLAAGTSLAVRIGETLSSVRNQPGDTFLATLTQPLVIDGWVIAERGARVEGRVVDTTPAGRVKGVSHLGISLVRLATADGQNIRIRTEPFVKDGPTSTGTDTAKIGAGAAIGAIIGAIAAGGKGAAIGAGAGGAAGTGDVLLTRGKPAEIAVETRVSFKVQDSVTITERLD